MAGKFTALKAKALTSPGRYGDGDGLWLQVRDASRRSWLFRYTRHGRARQMGLGAFPEVSLAEARDAAAELRRTLRQGGDPLDQRRAERVAKASAARFTFREVALRYHTAHQAGWRNTKHREQWKTQMEAYVFPVFGDLSVDRVGMAEVLKALEPIWHSKSMTATVLRGRIEAVLDFARVREWRSGDNPARWRGHLSKLLPPRSRIVKVKHHAALSYPEVGAFVAHLRASPDLAARALEFLILTATRTQEAMGARWDEIDLERALWTIPAHRMKGGREHRVPLSCPALAMLERLRTTHDTSPYVFPGPRGSKPLSNRACAVLLGRMKRQEITVHGFRSTFRDWASEETHYPREVAEAALAHGIEDRVEAAYRRGDLFAKRRQLMADWAKFCSRQPTPPTELLTRRSIPVTDG